MNLLEFTVEILDVFAAKKRYTPKRNRRLCQYVDPLGLALPDSSDGAASSDGAGDERDARIGQALLRFVTRAKPLHPSITREAINALSSATLR